MYYVSYEYAGNDEHDIKKYKDWFMYRPIEMHPLTGDDIMAINLQAMKEVMDKYNIEQDEILDDDIVILFIQELHG